MRRNDGRTDGKPMLNALFPTCDGIITLHDIIQLVVSVHSNYMCISCCFTDTVTYWFKSQIFPTPPVFNAATEHNPLGHSPWYSVLEN